MLVGPRRPPLPSPALRPSLARRLFLTVIPAMIVVSVAASTIWGVNGLVVRAHLQQDQRTASHRLATMDRENQRLLRDLELMHSDPVVIERIVAEELGWGRSDAVLYRFEDE